VRFSGGRSSRLRIVREAPSNDNARHRRLVTGVFRDVNIRRSITISGPDGLSRENIDALQV